MGINLGGAIGSLYLGSTKIKEAYLGSVKVFSSDPSPVELPEFTMRFRFTDTTYDPRTLYPTEGGTKWYKGTWTKVNNTGFNDWDWYNNSVDWSYGPASNSTTYPEYKMHLSNIEYVIIGMNPVGVTNFSYLFYKQYKLKRIYPKIDFNTASTDNPLFVDCFKLEKLPEYYNMNSPSYSIVLKAFGINSVSNINQYEGLRFIRGGTSSWYYNTFCDTSFNNEEDNLSNDAIRKRNFNPNSNITHCEILKYYTDNNTTKLFPRSKLCLKNCNIHGSARDYVKNFSSSVSSRQMIQTFMNSTIDYAYTSLDFPTNVNGSWSKCFSGCFDLKNFTQCPTLIEQYSTGDKEAFHLAGMNSSYGRSDLASISSTYGGGATQEFRNIYINNNCIPPGFEMMSSTSNHRLGVSFFWPKSLSASDSTREYSFHNPQSSTTINRNMFSGHGNYKGMTASDTTKQLRIYFGVFQLDDEGNLTWGINTKVLHSIAIGANSVSGYRNYTNYTLKNYFNSGISYTDFDPNKVVIMNFWAFYDGEADRSKNYFFMHGPSGSSNYGWLSTSYKMLELKDITVGSFQDD